MLGLIADGGIAATFGIVLLLAMVVAVVGVFGLMFKIAAAVLRMIFGGSRPHVERRPRRPYQNRPSSSRSDGQRQCENKRCGYANRRSAIYCARCGERF